MWRNSEDMPTRIKDEETVILVRGGIYTHATTIMWCTARKKFMAAIDGGLVADKDSWTGDWLELEAELFEEWMEIPN